MSQENPIRFRRLSDALRHAAQGARGVTIVTSEKEETTLSYADLYTRAVAVLAGLQARGVSRGDNVILSCADLEGFVTTLWGCILGGIVPAPLAVGQSEDHKRKLFAVWETLENPSLLTDPTAFQLIETYAAAHGLDQRLAAISGRTHMIDALPLAEGDATPCVGEGDDTAFIQFSSGSTGSPKGVVLTHDNIIANVEDTALRSSYTGDDVFLNWMPLTHDMGIVGYHFTAVLMGASQVIIRTDAFVWNPTIWMSKISKHKATVIGSPNFGYLHLLKLMRKGSDYDWDLSSIRTILNGAEPISAPLIDRFLTRMAPFGLDPLSMRPAYGLAEASLIISQTEPGDPIRTIWLDREAMLPETPIIESLPTLATSVPFVDVGAPLDRVRIRIDDKAGVPLPDDVIGRIVVSGPNVTAGYYRNDAANKAIFTDDGWLDTGDLGFLRNGRLFITGRAKDIIFVNGVNYYPHDLETIAQEVEGISLNKVACCGVRGRDQESERIVFFVMFKQNLERFAPLARALKEHLLRATGLSVDLVIPVSKLPKTTSGKLQRFALATRFIHGEFDEKVASLARLDADAANGPRLDTFPPNQRANALARWMAAEVETMTGGRLDPTIPLREQGVDSLRVTALHERLNTALGIDTPVSIMFDQPTLVALADVVTGRWLDGSEPATVAATTRPLPEAGAPVAIIGVGLRFPGGCDNTEAFWRLLDQGIDASSGIPTDRWDGALHYQPGDPANGKMYTQRGSFIDAVGDFDASLFGVTPVEAASLDPQYRLSLEVAWETLENAGMAPDQMQGSSTGVFVGVSNDDYVAAHYRSGDLARISPYSFTGSAFSTGVGRLSYTFGFNGPNMPIDTACSSSLVAVHLAMQSLRRRECDVALAGGVNLILTPEASIGLCQLGALSPDGRCKPFSATADGYGRGEGCGMVALKLLDDAIRDGDDIKGIIRGSAINHDGKSNGLTAPNGAAQRAVIAAALADAGVAPEAVSYVETHGTGTPLGDPIEADALADAYRKSADTPLTIGSVKSNIGHLESAAGIAGLIKLTLSLQQGIVPGTLHANERNPRIRWNRTPLRLATSKESWEGIDGVRRAGLSSFGFSGVNAHLIVEEAPVAIEPAPVAPPLYPVATLSARNETALAELARRHAVALRSGVDPFDLLRTLNTGRARLGVRAALSGETSDELRQGFEALASGESAPSVTLPAEDFSRQGVVFMFTGQGAQYPGMGRALYETEPVFRETFDHLSATAEPSIGRSLVDLLYGDDQEPGAIDQTGVTQPLLFAFDYALYTLWRSWGVSPSALLGHSVGEYVAAAVAGIFSPEEGVRLTAERGRLMQALPAGGAMASIMSPPDAIAEVAAECGASMAAWNSPVNGVVSGPIDAVKKVAAIFTERGIKSTLLPVSHGFHSSLMEPALAPFAAVMASSRLKAPTLPIISNVTGKRLTADEAVTEDYWARHLRAPVRFGDSIETLINDGYQLFLEIGPTAALTPLAMAQGGDRAMAAIASLRRKEPVAKQMGVALRQLFVHGAVIDWRRYHAGRKGRVVPAPTYPFERRRHWIDLNPSAIAPRAADLGATPPRAASTPADGLSRIARLTKEVHGIMGAVASLTPADIDPKRNFFELGLDSLLVVQVRQAIIRQYGIDLSLAEIYTKVDTVDKLIARLDETLPADAPTALATPTGDTPLERLVADQLQAMSSLINTQLEALNGAPAKSVAKQERTPLSSHGPVAAVETKETLGPRRKEAARRLAERYNRLTPGSKEMAERHRPHYANSRAVIGFRPEFKEMIYPVVVDRAEGATIHDIDGRRYVDITMGFGVTLFGHNPPFVRKALEAELAAGFPTGPQSRHAGEVARLIHEMTGVDRSAFFTTGTESIMAAIRISRMATGRNKIVIFTGAFHGSFDGVLAAGGMMGDEPLTFPIAAGTPQAMVDDVIVLKYGDPSALETIRRFGPELAAVLVEPVQSRHPETQPVGFLQELRALTEESGTVLVFDEMILGFRLGPKGAQAWCDVKADLVTYGKVVGGGMPIGVVSGKASIMDLVDGGQWRYGDTSAPSDRAAFVAGTFNGNGMAMAAARAILERLADVGPAMQTELNERTERFCRDAEAIFASYDAPIDVVRFGSLFRFVFREETEVMNYYLLTHGVYVWEGRNCFLSAAHTDDDVAAILSAIDTSMKEMRADGWFDDDPPVAPGETIPLSQSQKEMLFLVDQGMEQSLAYHEIVVVGLSNALDETGLGKAIAAVAERHRLLKAVSLTAEAAIVDPLASPSFRVVASTDPEAILAHEATTPFTTGPYARFTLIKEKEQARLALVAHHLIADGWSLGLIMDEVAALYNEYIGGAKADLSPATSYADFVAWEKGAQPEESAIAAPSAPALDLPTDHPRALTKGYEGGRLRFGLDADEAEALRNYSRRRGVSLFTFYFSAFAALLSRLSGQERYLIGAPTASHAAMGVERIVGQLTTMVPIAIDAPVDVGSDQLLDRMKVIVAEAFDRHEKQGAITGATPINAIFNLDRNVNIRFDGAETRFLPSPIRYVKFDLFLNVIEFNGETLFDFDYRSDLFDEATITQWRDWYREILRAMVADPHAPLSIASDTNRPEPMSLRSLWKRYQLPNHVTLLDATDPTVLALADHLRADGLTVIGAGTLSAASGVVAIPYPLWRRSILEPVEPYGPLPTAVIVTGEPMTAAVAALWNRSSYRQVPLYHAVTVGSSLVIGPVDPLGARDPQRRYPFQVVEKEFAVIDHRGAPLPDGIYGTLTGSDWYGRRRGDGAIEIAGRIDDIVATDRRRINLSITHAALEASMHVAAAALTFNRVNGISALIEATRNGLTDEALIERIRFQLSGSLPVEERPKRYGIVETIPRDRHGVIDHQAVALLQPAWIDALPYREPSSETESSLTLIWRQVLRLDRVGVDENFFELGGQSVAAARLVSRINRTFGASLLLSEIFAHPTIATLAQRIDNARGDDGSIPLLPKADDYLASDPQKRLWLLDQIEPGLTAYNIPLVMAFSTSVQVTPLTQALDLLVERHEALRTRFVDDDGEPRQVIDPATSFPLNIVDLANEPTPYEQALSLADEAIGRPFDLTNGPLFRGTLFTLGDRETTELLALTVHHTVADGWSMRILVDELFTLYDACVHQRTPHLPALEAQYKEYAAWANERRTSPVIDASVAWWRERLAHSPLPYDAPGAKKRPDEKTFNGRSFRFRIGSAAKEALLAASHRVGGSLYTTLTATLNASLALDAGREELTIGTVVSGRTRPSFDPLIGFFVNNLPLRLPAKPAWTFDEMVSACTENIIGALNHQELPYDVMVEEFGGDRDRSRNPLFDVMIVMDDREEIYRRMAHYGAREELRDQGVAQFDLTFYLIDEENDLLIDLVYNSDIYAPSVVERIVDRFRRIIPLADSADPLRESDPAPSDNPLLPLTEHQARLWFVDAFEKGDLYDGAPTYYNMPVMLRFDYGADAHVAQRELNLLVNATDTFRVRFESDGDHPAQRLASNVAIPFDTIPDVLEENLIEQAVAASQRPFDMDGGSLIRATLLGSISGPQLLLITAHHAIADKASMLRLGTELLRRYDAIEHGAEPGPVASSHRLADRIDAERSMTAEERDRQIAHYTTRLAGLTALELPTDHPRPKVHTYTAGYRLFTLDKGTSDTLRAYAASRDVSIEALLLALFQTQLGRFAAQETVAIGVPLPFDETNGRGYGPDTNLTVHLTTVQPERPFDSSLRETAASLASARQNRTLPFDTLVRALKPTNDMSRTALFDVLFHFESKRADRRIIDVDLGWGKYDLNLCLRETENGFAASLVYNVDLFDDDTADRIVGHFQTITAGLDPDTNVRCGDVPLLPSEERQRLDSYAGAAIGWPTDTTIPQLFSAQAARAPDRVALIMDDQRITYQALEKKANRLAAHLIERGVTPGCLVAVYLDRSIELVTTFLAVLKVGCGYVPVDPDYPADRGAFMLDDCGAVAVVTTTPLQASIPFGDATIILLDAEADEITSHPEAPPTLSVNPHGTAYVIYTSGSTGKPKGVMVSHQNVVRLLMNDAPLFDFLETDVWTMFHSPCFDFSVWEMYGALLHGGALVIVPKDIARSPSSFRALLAREKVTVINQTPTAFYALQQEDATSDDPLSVRYMIFGGEALKPDLLAPWNNRYPTAKLVNMYGITETTVHVTYKEIGPDEIATGRSNIGVAIPTTTLRPLDRLLNPVPIGTPGELCVGGAGVALGYLNRDELTAEKFVDDPFNPGHRLYRSGDQGRLLPNGDIEYRGRIDRQVKIRGFRIEPGEIEKRLQQYPDVKEALVMVRHDANRGDYLSAYIVADARFSADGLRTFASVALPDYMIPSAFTRIDAFPMTVNGKVDLDALAETEEEGVAGDGGAPVGSVERGIAHVWEEALGKEGIGVNDNFFALGGHSLLAAKVVARVKKALGLTVTLKQFFSHPTIAGIAALSTESRAPADVGITPTPPQDVYPVSYAQRRLWTFDQMESGSVAYNSYGAFLLKGTLDETALARAIEGVVARHESLRTVIVTREGAPVQMVKDDIGFVVERVDLTGEANPMALARRRVEVEMTTPFDLAHGPLIRASLLTLAMNEYALIVNLHHCVSDGWSVNVFTKEIERLYNLQKMGKGDSLPPLAIHYKDYTLWQKARLTGGALDASRHYWKGRFAEPVAPLDLPTDYPRSKEKSYQGAWLKRSLGVSTADQLQQLAQRSGASLFTILSAGVAVLLARLSGQRRVVIGSPVAGRTDVALHDQIGFYVNTLPLIADIEENSRFTDLIDAMKRTVTDALDHQDYPFDLLVEELDLKRDRSRNPLFDVMVIMQNNDPLTLNLPGVEFSVFMDETVSSKFDLNFMFEERDDIGIEMILEFDTALYRTETIERFAEALTTMLADMATDENASALLSDTGDGEAERNDFLLSTQSIEEDF